MLGRKDYTREELDHCKAEIGKQLAAYKDLAAAIDPADEKAAEAIAKFDALFFNNMALALDRYFVHRLRVVTGKDGNPLNEVELISDSLMNNNRLMRASNVIKMIPDQSVVKLAAGDQIKLTESDFERLSNAFFAALERKFVKYPPARARAAAAMNRCCCRNPGRHRSAEPLLLPGQRR